MDDVNPLISAIDNHNIANGDDSWFSKKATATGDLFEDVGEAVTVGAASSVVAGVNSIINSGIAVMNFLGAEVEPISTYKTLKELDDNFGKYYKEHEAGVDISGFLIGSLIPGTAGVKALNAAKAGFIGTNMAKSSGLMTSLTENYATAAKIEFATGGSPFSVLNQNVIKSLAQGLGSSTLEAAAFETAVAATMFKSPVLEEQNGFNILHSIAVGGLIGGGIGGIMHGVGTVYGIKKAGAKVDKDLFPYKHIQELEDTASSDLKLINYFQQKFNRPEFEEGLAISGMNVEDSTKLILKTDKATTDRLDILIRQEFNRYAGGDEVIAQQMFDVFQQAKTIDDVIAAIINSKGMTRITENESLIVGDVLFPTHGLSREAFGEILSKGKTGELLVDQATKGTSGYRVIGDTSKLKVTGVGEKTGVGYLANRDAAFAAGYDLYRNHNGTISINPSSTILAPSNARRIPNNLVIDFEQGGAVVSKATPGLADLASKAKPLEVRGTTVLSGDVDPIKIGSSKAFNPLEDDYLKVQARYIWAQEQKNIKWDGLVINENDLPMLERAFYEADKAKGWLIQLENPTGGVKATLAPGGEQLKNFIAAKKYDLAQKLNGKPLDELSLRLNVSEKWLSGEQDEIAKLRPGVNYNNPRYARIDYPDSIQAMEAYNAAYLDGAIQYENSVNMIKQRHQQTFGNYAGDISEQFPEGPIWSDPGRTPTRLGAGASLFGFANSNFGTAGGWAQYVGTLTNRLKIAKKTETIKQLSDGAARVTTPELRAELDLVTNKLRSSPEAWVFHPADNTVLIPRKDLKMVLKGGKPSETIEMSEEVAQFGRIHSSLNDPRQVHIRNMKGSAGVMDDTDLAGVWYPPPLDTSKYKHFVFVEPKGMTLGDRKRVIVAKDESTLEKLIGQVDQNDFRIITKTDSEEFHKAIGDYDFQLGLNESLVDSSLKRKGVLSEHFAGNPSTRILDDYLEWHTKQEEILATRMVEHRYSQSFEELRHLGASYTNTATSQFRSLTDALVESVKDPYNDIVKTALDISRAGEYKWWRSFNDTVRSAVEGPSRQLGAIFQKSPDITDAFVDEVNRKAQALGLGMPFRDSATALIASKNIADKPFLGKYIAKAQALMSTTLLQLDFFNALNNVISTPILLSSETKYLLNAIKAGNPEVAGKLSQLMNTTTPEGANALTMPSVGKLIRNAVENYRLDEAQNLGLLKRYQQIGAVTDVLQQERQMLGELTNDFGKLTASQADSSIRKATEFGKKWTGNKLAEEMTRFVSADVMRQLTDLAVESGVLQSVKEADEYIQLFVNKVQGNYLHSQRPIVFQGVVGQAVSLFQTYQFNLMQQLFKYVGDGDTKSLSMLLGLQGSIYGMQGLPAFNFLNTHIVGNASGNTEHRDLHFAANSVFGKQLGDWMLYGAGSNALGLIDPALKLNIYSRGDINPRQATVLPSNIEDIPVVSASVRFVRNLLTAVERTGNGAAIWPTVSQAIEHNGLSRPLAGLAQIVQGYTTTNQGSLLSSSQDFYQIATISRLAGGKPYDEAIALDALYRVNAYRAADLSRIQDVGSALKTSLVGNRIPTEQETTDFAVRYARAGGRIENFNRFMTNQMLTANKSQVNKLAENLTSPFAKQMQIVMGGTPVPDFINAPATNPITAGLP